MRDVIAELLYDCKFEELENLHKLNVLNKQLELLNPHNILARGYAIVHNQSGNIISSKNDTILEDLLQVTLADGELTVRVIENA